MTSPLVVTITMKTPWVPFNYYLCGGIGSQFAFIAEPNWLATGSQTNPVGTGPVHLPGVGAEQPLHRHAEPQLLAQGDALPRQHHLQAHPRRRPDPAPACNSGAIDILHTDTASDITRCGPTRRWPTATTPRYVAGEPDMGCIHAEPVQGAVQQPEAAPGHGLRHRSQQYVKVIDQGVTEPTNGVFTSTSPYYLSDNGYPEYNLSKAKQLVSEIKSSGGSVAFTLGHTPDPKGSQIGQYLQQVLQSAGMVVTLVPILQDSIINTALTGAYEALTWRQFGAVNPDLNYIFWTPTNASTPDSPSTWPATPTRPCRRRCSRAASPPTSPTQVAAYQQVNKLLSKDIPYVWYARTVWAIGAQPKVQNFNNPTTPAGAKAFGLIGGAIWPQQIWLS